MSSIVCSNCKLSLLTDTELRSHYKSDFHQYNIKRSLVGLGPVDKDTFEVKKARKNRYYFQFSSIFLFSMHFVD